MDAVFITDVHIKAVSKVRSGDVLDDICQKLNFVVDYCNRNNCILLCGGDLFDKPTIPDIVKARVAEVFKKLNTKLYCTQGNHDMLYNNPSFNNKTSYNLFTKSGIIEDLDQCDYVDMSDYILTSKLPIITREKPQIVIFHGFLNQEDGRNTLRFTDIDTSSNTLILLGHDHCVYEDLRYTPNVKIVRPGSLLRGERSDEHKRIPQLVHIRVTDGKILTKKVDIPCRDWKEIFTTKTLDITKSQQRQTYDLIIEQLRNARKADMTLEEALNQVAEPDVVSFIMNLLEETTINNQFKNQNL